MVFEVTATGAALTAALAKLGATYGYAIDPTTGYGYLNLADTTNAVFQLEDGLIYGGGTTGDTNVWV